MLNSPSCQLNDESTMSPVPPAIRDERAKKSDYEWSDPGLNSIGHDRYYHSSDHYDDESYGSERRQIPPLAKRAGKN